MGWGLGNIMSEAFGSKNKFQAQAPTVTRSNYEYAGTPGGADEAANRYRQQAEQAQNRGAPQADFSGAQPNYRSANQWQGNAAQERIQQNSLANLMMRRATGQAPSVAEMEGRRQMGQVANMQAAQAGSARGSAGLALAGQTAANNTANAQAQIANQTQINAANERMQAEQNAFGAYSGVRGQDVSQQALGEQRGQFGANLATGQQQFNTQQQAQQRALNDQYSMGMTGNEMGVRNAQLTGGMNLGAQTSSNSLQSQQVNASVAGQNAATNQKNGEGILGSIGSVAGALFSMSDERSKNYLPMRADGGPVHGGQATIVGERGPEVIVPKRDGYVIPNEALAPIHWEPSGGASIGGREVQAPPRQSSGYRPSAESRHESTEAGAEQLKRQADAQIAAYHAGLKQGASVARDEGEIEQAPAGWLTEYINSQREAPELLAQRAKGGPVRKGQPTLVGEKGREAFVSAGDADSWQLTPEERRSYERNNETPYQGPAPWLSRVMEPQQATSAPVSTWGTGRGITPTEVQALEDKARGDTVAATLRNQELDRDRERRLPSSTAFAVPRLSPGVRDPNDRSKYMTGAEPLQRADREEIDLARAKQAEGIDLSDEEQQDLNSAQYRLGEEKKTQNQQTAEEEKSKKGVANVFRSLGQQYGQQAASVDTRYHGPAGYSAPQLIPIPGRATGGMVRGGQPYMMGENGPELLTTAPGGSMGMKGLETEESGGMGGMLSMMQGMGGMGGSAAMSDERTKRQAFAAGMNYAQANVDAGEAQPVPKEYAAPQREMKSFQRTSTDSSKRTAPTLEEAAAHNRADADRRYGDAADIALKGYHALVPPNPPLLAAHAIGAGLTAADAYQRDRYARDQEAMAAADRQARERPLEGLPPPATPLREVMSMNRPENDPGSMGSDERTKNQLERMTHSPLASAARAEQGSAYTYKPEFTPPDEEPGEVHVGPRSAQQMARDPVARTVVKERPDGMLVLDPVKMTKLNGAINASQQRQIDWLADMIMRGHR